MLKALCGAWGKSMKVLKFRFPHAEEELCPTVLQDSRFCPLLDCSSLDTQHIELPVISRIADTYNMNVVCLLTPMAELTCGEAYLSREQVS